MAFFLIKAEARQLTDIEKAELVNEYIASTGKKVVDKNDDISQVQNPNSYRKISDKEIAPAMAEAVSEFDKTEAAKEAIFAEQKPAEQAKTAEPTKTEENKQKFEDFGFSKENGLSLNRKEQEFTELNQEKNK